jgi:glyoxylase-like metal-dependent hydrolase (beta-lactamase superfamily II)
VSEPRAVADRVEELLPGVFRWWVADERIGGLESEAYAVADGRRVTLVDPLPIDPAALARLGTIEAVVLTAPCHQRAAWRLRRVFAAPVFAPEGAQVGYRPGELEQAPDAVYRDRYLLTGGLEAFHAPGPDEDMFALWLERHRAIFVSDLLTHHGGALRFVPDALQEEPARTRLSVARLAARLPVEAVLFAHGPPILRGGRVALEDAVAADSHAERTPGADGHP